MFCSTTTNTILFGVLTVNDNIKQRIEKLIQRRRAAYPDTQKILLSTWSQMLSSELKEKAFPSI
jgi:hypothetical protein